MRDVSDSMQLMCCCKKMRKLPAGQMNLSLFSLLDEYFLQETAAIAYWIDQGR